MAEYGVKKCFPPKTGNHSPIQTGSVFLFFLIEYAIIVNNAVRV